MLVRRYYQMVVLAGLACAWPAFAQSVGGTISSTDLFALADKARDARHYRDAQTIYDALASNRDAEIRAEARFRKGVMLEGLKRYHEAAVSFRALLDEKPGATRVRLELARVLAMMGDESGARREFRQAQAAGLPPDVALVVNRFANALRNNRKFGGSLQVALAPDSNVNRATDARTLDTIIAPLNLSRDARERSGLGFHFSGQVYAHLPLTDTLSIVPRISGQGDVFGEHRFDDISATALAGLEWRTGLERITVSGGQAWRWYGGPLYARTTTATFDWLHPAGRKAQIEMQGSISKASYQRNDLQGGMIYAGSASYERAFGEKTGGSLTLDVARQSARDPGYATWSGGGTLLAWRTVGRSTFFASIGLHHLQGDARLFLFPDRRREWLYQGTVGGTFRRFTLAGFAPTVQFAVERNASTVGIYDYRRISSQIGITRAF
jgi:tetratricopeptide (TPR) repeat protein